MWVPSQVDIKYNEFADSVAAKAKHRSLLKYTIWEPRNYLSIIQSYFNAKKKKNQRLKQL